MATLNVFITNLGAYVAGELRGEWLGLPASEEERKAAWERIGAPEEVFYTDYEAEDVPGIASKLGEFESLDKLEELEKEGDTLIIRPGRARAADIGGSDRGGHGVLYAGRGGADGTVRGGAGRSIYTDRGRGQRGGFGLLLRNGDRSN